MNVDIRGIGLWGRGLRSWPEFRALVAADNDGTDAEWQVPAPEAIPARERRRSPLMVKLAVEVAYQACAMADVDPQDIATVFSSSMGDTEITDYMCRVLAGESKVLSPTRFHNSVHNAPAGYWSISAENRAPSTSVAWSRESFSAAKLESCTLSVTEERQVLLISSDIFVPKPLGDVYPIGEPFGVALLLDACVTGDEAWSVSIGRFEKRSAWPDIRHPLLRSISECNPAARCLALLEAVADGNPGPIQWPLNNSTYLKLMQSAADAEDRLT